MPAPSNLLTVGEAARLLGVHVATIRRWTDQGKLPDVRTAGGHRRIPREAVERLMGGDLEAESRAIASLSDRAWAEHALVHTRFEVQAHPETVWNQALSEDERARSRENGQRLMGLLLRHVAGTGGAGEAWEEVRRLSRRYAAQMRERGLLQSDALRATLFFRDALTESTAYYPHFDEQPPRAQISLLRKVNEFMNEVQLAIIGAYEEGESA